MKFFLFPSLILCPSLSIALCLQLCAECPAETARKLEAYSQGELQKVVALYHAGKRTEALEQVSNSLLLAEVEFGRNHAFYEKVWSEAQNHTGKKDEAWGLDLYLRLLDFEQRENNATGSLQREIEYAINGNILGMLRSIGRITEARRLATLGESSLITFAHLDTVNRPYGDLGPLFPFLPSARKRNFPLMDPEKPADTLHFYTRIYAIYEIASASLDVGDWVRAAELYRWVADYAAVYCQPDIPRIRNREVCRYSMDAHSNLAAICIWHGFQPEADAIYKQFITTASQKDYPVEVAALAVMRLKQLVNQSTYGALPEDAVEIAEDCAEIIVGHNRYGRPTEFEARISVARIYYAKGNRARAWEIIAELLAMMEADVNPHHRIRILEPMTDFALEEGGIHPELESWLSQRLNFERSMGNKFNELALYEKYARFLILNNRLSEAMEIVEETIRLSVVMNVAFRAKSYRELLQSIKDRAEKESRKVDLQPMSSRSTVVRDSTAYARFYLTNPSSIYKAGILKMTGPIATDSQPDVNQRSLVLDTTVTVKTIERPLVLAPGSSMVLNLTGSGAKHDVETEFTCVWMEEGDTVSQGIWLYQSSDVTTRMSVVDAHAVRISPFHLFPVRHMLQRTELNGVSENIDFRISASEPMRIEVYDGTGTRLIAVDANGDGDYKDKGDLVYQDLNGNGHPDLKMAEGETLASLTLYVDPAQIEPKEGTISREVSIFVLEDGKWHLDAVDIIE